MLNLIIPVVVPHLQGLLKSVTKKPKIGDVTIELMWYESYLYDANTRISSLVCVETLLIDRSTLLADFIGIILFLINFTLYRILIIILTFPSIVITTSLFASLFHRCLAHLHKFYHNYSFIAYNLFRLQFNMKGCIHQQSSNNIIEQVYSWMLFLDKCPIKHLVGPASYRANTSKYVIKLFIYY